LRCRGSLEQGWDLRFEAQVQAHTSGKADVGGRGYTVKKGDLSPGERKREGVESGNEDGVVVRVVEGEERDGHSMVTDGARWAITREGGMQFG